MKIQKPGALQIIITVLIILPYLGMFFVYQWYNKKAEDIENAHMVLISKEEMSLSVYDYKGNELCKFPIACGSNYGNKQEEGDMKTPEGVFRISEIQDASKWKHDFNDGNGEIPGAYGPYFVRLAVPGHKGIGIHGTHDPGSMEKRVTEGCIRLKNEDLEKFIPMIHNGTVVIITTSANDIRI
jgi:lipoprotein-anchoring transpeptidase ErfK/SrfK